MAKKVKINIKAYHENINFYNRRDLAIFEVKNENDKLNGIWLGKKNSLAGDIVSLYRALV